MEGESTEGVSAKRILAPWLLLRRTPVLGTEGTVWLWLDHPESTLFQAPQFE